MKGKTKRIAVFWDVPNMFVNIIQINVPKIIEQIKQWGEIVMQKAYFTTRTSITLVPVFNIFGIEAKISEVDIDALMSLDVYKTSLSKKVDIIVLVTRDNDFIHAIIEAKKNGKQVYVIGFEPYFGKFLKYAANRAFLIQPDNTLIEVSGNNNGKVVEW